MSAAGAALRRVRPGHRVRAVAGALAPPPHIRRRLVVLALVAAILGGLYLVVIRNLGVFSVNKVQVSGLSGADADAARAALTEAAGDSTTLHVDHGALAAAADRFPVIRSVSVQTDFPHGMRISVSQERPAAMLLAAGRRIPVAGDGSILTGLPIRTALPTVSVGGAVPQKELTASGTLDAVRVLGGAPALLTPQLGSINRQKGKGWVVKVDDGPDLVFGPATRIAAKWLAVTRILADRDAAGADYIDVRLPDRPAAGGLPVQTVQPVAPADSGDPAQGQAAPSQTPQQTPQPGVEP